MRLSPAAVIVNGLRGSIRLRIVFIASLQRRSNEFGYVEYVRTRTDDTFEHRRAVRATHRDDLGANRPCVGNADIRNALLAGDVRQRRTSATAAATPAFAVTLHLDHLDAD